MKTLFNSIFTLLFIVFSYGFCNGQTYYWIGFKDKAGTTFSVNKPEEFLSERAIERREKMNIPIDETDLPVSPDYISAILDLGAELVHSSKWLNGVTVKTGSLDFIGNLNQLPFVKEYEVTKNQVMEKAAKVAKFGSEDGNPIIDSAFYGASVSQVSQINGHYLHDNGYKGEGIHIAVLDAGFTNANQLSAFGSAWDNNQVLGWKDFVGFSPEVFSQHSHGTSVWSIMAANLPGQLIGTAPGASYWLIRTEDGGSEYLIEEDNWVVGAEFADSVGVDIINASLGYSIFDDPSMNHTYQEMDGNTTRVTIAADMAVSKGILVFNSAGNSGNKAWHYITAPSDGDSVICVGAVNAEGLKASFSSFGPAADGTVKPNVAAVGWGTAYQNIAGNITKGNGTSFSSPVMAGMAACLWQAYPEFSHMEIKQAIEESAHQFNNPDSLLGYGIPDFKAASDWLQAQRASVHPFEGSDWGAFPNPFTEKVTLLKEDRQLVDNIKIEIFSTDGVKYIKREFTNRNTFRLDELSILPPGVVIIRLTTSDISSTLKLLKTE